MSSFEPTIGLDVRHVLRGLVTRTGVIGPIGSVYFRGPESNLIEVSTYDEA